MKRREPRLRRILRTYVVADANLDISELHGTNVRMELPRSFPLIYTVRAIGPFSVCLGKIARCQRTHLHADETSHRTKFWRGYSWLRVWAIDCVLHTRRTLNLNDVYFSKLIDSGAPVYTLSAKSYAQGRLVCGPAAEKKYRRYRKLFPRTYQLSDRHWRDYALYHAVDVVDPISANGE